MGMIKLRLKRVEVVEFEDAVDEDETPDDVLAENLRSAKDMPERVFEGDSAVITGEIVRSDAAEASLTVESCLAELREMFPQGFCEIMFPTESGTAKNHLANVVIAVWDSTRANGSLLHFDGETLFEAMQFVREWKGEQDA
jgi:hypothetical protein